MSIAVVDCLARGSGKRYATLDVIGPGPRIIVSILRREDYDADLYPCEKVLSDPSNLKDYSVLMASGMSSDLEALSRVLKLWKRYSRKRKVSIVGGPVCVEYQSLIRMGYDIVIYGEAEKTLLELINVGALETRPKPEILRDIKGIAYRDEYGPRFTGTREWMSRHEFSQYIPDVESIARYDLYWAARVYVECVRGCSNFARPTIPLPNYPKCIECNRCREGPLRNRIICPLGIPPGCGYCCVPSLFGPARSRLEEPIVKEIRDLIGVGVSRIVLSAPDILDYGRDLLVEPEPLTDPRHPPPNIEALKSLFERIWNIPEVSSGEVTVMVENVKPNLVNEDVAKLLGKYFKGTPIYIGLETGHEELHKAIGRPTTVDEVLRAVKLLKDQGLRPYVYLIHGLPGENEETIEATLKVIDILENLGVEKIVLYRLTPLKGTAFEHVPKPKPAILNPVVKKLYDRVIEYNTKSKERFLNQLIEVIAVSRYPKNPEYLVTYPVKHGPVVLVKDSRDLVGYLILTKISKVISDRLVEGEIVKILKKIH